MLKQKLIQIGLTDYEASIYTLLLEKGPSTAQKIYTGTSINRVTTYNVLESLMRKGLVSSLDMAKKKVFIPEHPKQLIEFLDTKKKNLEHEKQQINFNQEKLKELIPELDIIYQSIGEKPKVRFFEGGEGIKHIQELLIESSKDTTKQVYEIFNEDHTKELDKKIGLDVHHRTKMIAKSMKENISSVAIYTYADEKNRLSMDFYPPNVDLNFVDQKTHPIESSIVLQDEKVAIITKNMTGILIENKDIGTTLRSVFELAVEALKIKNANHHRNGPA